MRQIDRRTLLCGITIGVLAAASRSPAARGFPTERPPPDVLTRLPRVVGRLHQRGILSDEEFAAKKAELLGRLSRRYRIRADRKWRITTHSAGGTFWAAALARLGLSQQVFRFGRPVWRLGDPHAPAPSSSNAVVLLSALHHGGKADIPSDSRLSWPCPRR